MHKKRRENNPKLMQLLRNSLNYGATRFYKVHLLVFVLIFGSIGGYLLLQSNAAGQPGASTATCSPSPCTAGTYVAHTSTALDSDGADAKSVSYPYAVERPNNLVGNAALVVVLEASPTDSTFTSVSVSGKFVILQAPPWHPGPAVAVPTIQSRLSPPPAPANCGTSGTSTCDDIPALKAAIDAVIAGGGIDTTRIYVTGPSKGGLQTLSAICDTRTYSYFSAAAVLSIAGMVENSATGAGTGSQTKPMFCPSMLGTDRTAGDGIGGAALNPPFKDMSLLFLYGTNDSLACTASNNAQPNCLDTGFIDNNGRWVMSYPQSAGDANPPNSTGATGRPSGGSSVMFGAIMGCGGTPSSTTVDTANGGNVTEKIYTGCTHSNRATGTVRVANAGHSWTGLDQIDGYSSEQATWDFFAAYGGPSTGGGDTTPPSTPTNLAKTASTGTSISLSWTASTDNVGVSGYDLYKNGVSTGNTTTSTSTTFTSLTCGNNYTLAVDAFDAAGNMSGQASGSFSTASCADATPPTVSITAPANGSTVSGSSVTVSANASDNVGVVGVQFKIDGTNLGAEDTASPYSLTWDTTQASNGSHTLTAIARDAAGNTTTATGITVSISNSSAVPGDFNGDSHVNALDLSILLSNYGGSGTSSTGDANGDGQVNALDLSTVLSHYGT